MLKLLDPLSLTEVSICSLYFNSVITLVVTSDELFCDKVLRMMLHSDSLTSIDRLFDKGLCTMISFDSSSSVSLKFDHRAVSSA